MAGDLWNSSAALIGRPDFLICRPWLPGRLSLEIKLSLITALPRSSTASAQDEGESNSPMKGQIPRQSVPRWLSGAGGWFRVPGRTHTEMISKPSTLGTSVAIILKDFMKTLFRLSISVVVLSFLASCAIPVSVPAATSVTQPTTAATSAPTSTNPVSPTTPPLPTNAPASTTSSTGTLVKDKIKHIVIIMQENRSFDEYFGTYPGADGIPMQNGVPTVCVNDPKTGTCVKPYHDPERCQLGRPACGCLGGHRYRRRKNGWFHQQPSAGRQKACKQTRIPRAVPLAKPRM